MSKSLCELIATSRTAEGMLPGHFSLPPIEGSEGPAFADGALDGITMHHMAPAFLNSPDKKELGRLVTLASDGSYDEAEAGFAEFCKKLKPGKPSKSYTIADWADVVNAINKADEAEATPPDDGSVDPEDLPF